MANAETPLLVGIVQHLLATTDVTHFTRKRIRPGKLSQDDELPAVRIRKISREDIRHHGGSAGFSKEEYEIDCVACKELQAEQLADAVRAAAPLFQSQYDNIQGCFPRDGRTSFDANREDANKGKHTARQIWTVWHAT